MIAGVAWLNLMFVAVGYCLLAPTLKQLPAFAWLTFAGLALLIGAACMGVALAILAIFGVETGYAAAIIVASVLAGAGTLAAGFAPARHLHAIRFHNVAPTPEGWWGVVASAAAALAAGICLLTIVAAFRSTPWLNDAWTFWLPKGILLRSHGLDERLFTQSALFLNFANPDYPLWWSVVTGLEMDFVGRIDLRALNAEIAILFGAFVVSVARLLWGRVRPSIVWLSLLALVGSPELLRQTQSGGADVPLAVFLALAVLASVLWLSSGSGHDLLVAGVAAAAAASIKVEGAPELVVLVALPALLVWPIVRRRSLVLVGTLLTALATTIPWHLWRAVHDVHSEFTARFGFDPSYLADHAERVGPSVHAVASGLVGRDWPLIVPLFLALSIGGALLERRAGWLVPAAALGACFAFWVWTYWTGSIPLDFWLQTSAYRVVDGVLLSAAVTIPLMAERLSSIRRGGISGRAR